MKKIRFAVICYGLTIALIGCSSSNLFLNPSTSAQMTFTPSGAGTPSPTVLPVIDQENFSFVSLGDSQTEVANFTTTIDKIASLHPDLLIFNGRMKINGGVNTEMKPLLAAIKNAGLLNQAFIAQLNYDDIRNDSTTLLENYLEPTPGMSLYPVSVSEYITLDSSSDFPNYSYIFRDSIFIGLDVPGAANLLTSDQMAFLDSRLIYAENKGLVHAFIFFHGPLYCIESTACDCTTRPEASCPPSELVSILDKHTIVSATFHGHDHILGWTHPENAGVTGITENSGELTTSPSGGLAFTQYLSPARMDYTYMDVGSSRGFSTISVNGNSFTVHFYKVGTNPPIWERTFTKGIAVATDANRAGVRPLKYYMADRVLENADFKKLAAWGINTAMVDFDVNGKVTDWRAVFSEAAKYGINIVIWPSDWIDRRPDCDWEAPYPVSANGDITKVKPLLDVASQYSNFIGILNGHEPLWTCTNMTFDEMAGLKTQLKAYALSKGREIKVWNYINSLYDESMYPASQIPRIVDVAIIWKHCVGDTTERCSGGDSTLARIKDSRARLTELGLGGKVDLVFVIQAFTSDSPYNVKFTLPELENTACKFLQTSALDGFGFYTWDAGWWSDLHGWPDLQPAILNIYDNCIHAAP